MTSRPGSGLAHAAGSEPALAGKAGYLVGVAARAPSLHNTQPWRFKVGDHAVELYADTDRQLAEDLAGREMLISCGAALFGLRLAVRSLGYLADVALLPEPAAPRLLARVLPGRAEPMTPLEQRMLRALPHRHTHRGPFEQEPLPAGLLPRLRRHAAAEGATLTVLDADTGYRELAAILTEWSQARHLDPVSRAEVLRWTRQAGARARDGVPAEAFPVTPRLDHDRVPQRDFDLGRGLGRLSSGGPPAAVTAVLTTRGDGPRDWLRAGQALQRLLLHAASQWVFADLQTQPLLTVPVRALIQARLALPGPPQMLLGLGVARAAHPTARRPAENLIEP